MPLTLAGLWSGQPALAPTASVNVWAVVQTLVAIYSRRMLTIGPAWRLTRSSC